MRRSQVEKALLGEAGEMLVLSRLLRRGYVASQAPRGWKADDIGLADERTVQVKTTDQGNTPEWLLPRTLEVQVDRFFALVDYRLAEAPVVYVLPSGDLEMAVASADRCYYEQRPQSKPFAGRTARDGWSHEVPAYPAGWLQPYREAWALLAECVTMRTE